jgi:hypothetical protein
MTQIKRIKKDLKSAFFPFFCGDLRSFKNEMLMTQIKRIKKSAFILFFCAYLRS